MGETRSRRDEMRLRYWAKLVRMGDERIAKIIYKTSRRRLEHEEAANLPLTMTWCKYTKRLIDRASSGRGLANRSCTKAENLLQDQKGIEV